LQKSNKQQYFYIFTQIIVDIVNLSLQDLEMLQKHHQQIHLLKFSMQHLMD